MLSYILGLLSVRVTHPLCLLNGFGSSPAKGPYLHPSIIHNCMSELNLKVHACCDGNLVFTIPGPCVPPCFPKWLYMLGCGYRS